MSMVESRPAYSEVRLLVVMGSSGCGKSTVGGALAQRLEAVFIEGDDHHSPENREKMANSIPLTDDDRWPWLAQLATVMREYQGTVVVSCSALKKAYRDHIGNGAGEPVLYVYLHGSSELLASRLSAREDHFMSKSLLDSQLATLEVPGDDELSITVDIDQHVDSILTEILGKVRP